MWLRDRQQGQHGFTLPSEATVKISRYSREKVAVNFLEEIREGSAEDKCLIGMHQGRTFLGQAMGPLMAEHQVGGRLAQGKWRVL